jgi:hypothetical protein
MFGLLGLRHSVSRRYSSLGNLPKSWIQQHAQEGRWGCFQAGGTLLRKSVACHDSNYSPRVKIWMPAPAVWTSGFLRRTGGFRRLPQAPVTAYCENRRGVGKIFGLEFSNSCLNFTRGPEPARSITNGDLRSDQTCCKGRQLSA